MYTHRTIRRNRIAGVAYLTGLILCSTLFLGCAQLGVPAPQSTEQGIAYMYPAIASVRDTTATLLNERKIKKAEAETVLSLTNNARSATDIARDYVRAKDESAAVKALSMAKSVLREARKYIGLPEDNNL